MMKNSMILEFENDIVDTCLKFPNEKFMGKRCYFPSKNLSIEILLRVLKFGQLYSLNHIQLLKEQVKNVDFFSAHVDFFMPLFYKSL